ncbi:hypothetical protein E1265_02300 [Streptomyces sp. 8K308]|uniref:hypothetical protein n=1 Tax=Streptomyces sp. 8K308 TaxID=2530388 RepID=UPI001049D1BC|nr:hypothetical protein [Streptomyces sp. 8K308]TDC27132.1 hypothetical protein E1265_02300 [Streptomyces sp. 8K308]
MRVLISPSYGSSGSRRHWADTVEREIEFARPQYATLLTPDQRDLLSMLHPEGSARFWGATESHDKKMADVARGDIVLFTGQNMVRAVGEVGAIFRNSAFADELWPPQPGETSWRTVYSLLDLSPVEYPYDRLNATLGYRPAHNFPGQMVVRGDKARAVLEEFMITSGTELSSIEASSPSDVVAWDAVRLAALEEKRTHTATFERTRRLVIVERRESELVSEFKQYLSAQGRKAERFYCPAGITDIYLDDPVDAELIEAKSKPTHYHIRQALGQLLDYAPHCPHPVRRLTGLFPNVPAISDIQLLHRYGIDVIHRKVPGVFQRLSAPDERRNLMRQVWSR